MEGFEKIDLSGENAASSRPLSTPSVTRISAAKSDVAKRPENSFTTNRTRKGKKFFQTKKTWVVLLVLIFLLLFSAFGIFLPSRNVYKQAQITSDKANLALDALKKQNITLMEEELTKTREELKKTESALGAMGYLGYIPFIGSYYGDATHLIKAGFHGLDAADTFVASVEPYADVLGLKGKGSFVGGTAEQRIETAVTTMSKITPKIDDIVNDLEMAKNEIDKIDPDRYPSFLIGNKLKAQIISAKKITDDGVTFAKEAKPLIKVLPKLLGEPNEKKYLVLFQNDKELRPTGGFLTAYAIFRVEHGIIHVDTSNDIYTLDDTISGKQQAPRPILEYLPKVPLLNLRDTNLSPDFVVSMNEFNKLYKKSSGPDVDGIVAINTRALVAIMNILGDIQAAGTTFTTKNNQTCNCPDVVYQLELSADKPVQGTRTNRKAIIGDLMYAIMNKAFSSSPKLYWGRLFQEMIVQTGQKNILFYVYDKQGQTGIEALNGAGRIKPFDGDYLHINEANFGGAKSNMFVTEEVTEDYQLKSDGTIVKTVTINYKNPFPPSDCNLERGGLCLNAALRDWVRVYVPKGSKLIDSQGSQVKVINYDELGKTVFEGFLEVRPQGSAKFMVSYQLPFKIESSTLPLLIQKQPGIDSFQHIITSQNRKLANFKLDTDKELKLTLPK
ncbi:MAG: hypothetical protein A2W22_03605 [Candidatus Levybacteria bacterium RBG_16_35_11]|nr:MAG: hypothetical protein A2W22_03605 [Candidatus Levybacteria bacterium RBG_16_35_11]